MKLLNYLYEKNENNLEGTPSYENQQNLLWIRLISKIICISLNGFSEGFPYKCVVNSSKKSRSSNFSVYYNLKFERFYFIYVDKSMMRL